jgi:uncharacterized delta-60 repeat protein
VALAIVCVGLVGCEPANLAIDPIYGGDGVADISQLDPFIYPHDFEVAADGSIITVLLDRLTRIRPDGTVDPTFGANAPAFRTAQAAAAVDASGRILTLGPGSTEDQLTVRRFTANGNPDPSFDGDGARTLVMGFEDSAADVQSDHAGRIVVFFRNDPQPGGQSTCQVVRLLPDGAVDPNFGGGLPVALDLPYSVSTGAQCNEVLVEDDNGLLAVDTHAGIARLSVTGAPLPYGPGPDAFMDITSEGIVDAALLPGGGIAVGASVYDSGDYRVIVAELTPVGDLDPAFGTGGMDIVGFVDLEPTTGNHDYSRLAWLSPTPEGSLIAVARHSTGAAVARWVNGHLDPGFASGGRLLVDDPLPYPHDLSDVITAGVARDGTLYVVSNRQGALAPLTLVHLARTA